MTVLEKLYGQFQPLAAAIGHEELNKILVTHNSTVLEGSTLTMIETALLIKDGITPAGKPLGHSNMVRDHYEALSFVLDRAKEKVPVTEGFVRTIAGKVMKTTGAVQKTVLGDYDVSKGDYRLSSAYANIEQGDGQVVSRYYPAHQKIPSSMGEFCSGLQQKMKAVEGIDKVYGLAFDAHYYLRSIHPFGDGNSRTSRLLMNFIQAYYGFPITPVQPNKRAEYLKAFYDSSAEDTTPMRDFLLAQACAYMGGMVEASKLEEKSIKGQGISEGQQSDDRKPGGQRM